MPRTKKVPEKTATKRRPALDPEARENQMIALAESIVEERMLNGTATAQELIHYLRLGSSKARLELEMLEKEKALKEAKTENLNAQRRNEELIENALEAFKRYSGHWSNEEVFRATDDR